MLLKWHVTLQSRETEAHLRRLALLLTFKEVWVEVVVAIDKFFNTVVRIPK